MRRYGLVGVLMFSLLLGSLCAQDFSFQEEVQKLDSLKGDDFRKAVSLIYDSFDSITDYQMKVKLTEKIFDITVQKDEQAHIQSLIMKVTFTDTPNTKFYNEAYRLAKKYDRIDDMCFVEYSRSQYYIAQKQYDSAMIHLLGYRDMTPADKKNEGYRNIINLMGDIYYHAGLYDQAWEIYHDLYQQYVEENNWNFYRPYVMMNNLGQIALYTGNLQDAKDWFTKSLLLAEQNLLASYRNNTIAYIKIKLAETALHGNDIIKAEKLLDEVASYPEKYLFEDVLQENIYVRAEMLLKKGMLDDALKMSLQLIPSDSLFLNQSRFIPEVYNLLSEIYIQKMDYEASLYFLHEYQNITDSLHKSENIAQSMIILADHNHELTQLDLEKSKQRIKILVSGLIILLLILFIILILYRKLYRSKLELVRKSLERNTYAGSKNNIKNNASQIHDSNEEIDQERQLAGRLHEFMRTDKPFLNPKLSIDEVARQLSTNRTYLSRAINNYLNTTFPNFLNEYRIKEAIQMISSGYTINHTQEALAKQSGFASRTVFISAFKKYTGVLPSFFIANYKKEDPKP